LFYEFGLLIEESESRKLLISFFLLFLLPIALGAPGAPSIILLGENSMKFKLSLSL
jgi:hypothetical protein